MIERLRIWAPTIALILLTAGPALAGGGGGGGGVKAATVPDPAIPLVLLLQSIALLGYRIRRR